MLFVSVLRRTAEEKEGTVMARYITTYTGAHFYPTEPRAEDICIEDIAHSLSMLCRANGHYRRFYSVADHCIDCAAEAEARGLGDRMVMFCLLHDAAEAYISDIPRPVKRELAGIDETEERLICMIFEKFAGRLPDAAEMKQIREIDDAMLFHEFKANMGEILGQAEIKAKRTFETRPPETAESEFLELFERIEKALQAL